MEAGLEGGGGEVVEGGLGEFEVEGEFGGHAAGEGGAGGFEVFAEEAGLLGRKWCQLIQKFIESVDIFSELRLIHGLTESKSGANWRTH